jgi:hypothetical protein
MRSAFARFAFALLAIGVSSGGAAQVRLSFLNNHQALQDTLDMLQQAGCPRSVGISLQKAADRYSTRPLKLDLRRFPMPRNGFYEFASASLLVDALPESLFLTQHGSTISCLDTVILLTMGQLRAKLEIDTPGGPFLIGYHITNGVQGYYPVATPRDVWDVFEAPWHTKEAEAVLPSSMAEQHVCLNAALRCCAPLPCFGPTNVSPDVIGKALRWNWQRDGVVFPANSEIVMCHAVMGTPPWRTVEPVHAGVLFPRSGHYTYVEKSGLSGPFVRLDVERKEDLLVWLQALLEGIADLGYSDYFITFNGSNPRVLHVPHVLRQTPQESKNSSKQ